jgi:hypothetical protein
MTVNVVGVGETTLFKATCIHFFVQGVDLPLIGEEVLRSASFDERLANNKVTHGPEYEDSYFEYGPETIKLKNAVDAVADTLGMEVTNRIWAQVHRPYESCNLHDHLGDPTNMGFVFYVKALPGAGRLYFDFGPAGTSVVEPIENMLVIFPAYLKHGVTKNLSGDLRISIAGDLRKKQ